MVQLVKIIFYKEVVLLVFFWLHFFIFFILPVLLGSYFRIQESKKYRRTYEINKHNKLLSVEKIFQSFSFLVIYSFFTVILLNIYKIINTNGFLYSIYLVLNTVIIFFIILYDFRKIIIKISETKILNNIIRTSLILFFIFINLLSSAYVNLEMETILHESTSLFPIALYVTSLAVSTFILMGGLIILLTSLSLLITAPMILSLFLNIIKTRSLIILKTKVDYYLQKNMIGIISTFIIPLSIILTFYNLFSYYNDNGIEKILRYTSYIEVNENCGFNKDKNTWLSYLGGGNISVLTLDESGNYHFKSRPCEPKENLN